MKTSGQFNFLARRDNGIFFRPVAKTMWFDYSPVMSAKFKPQFTAIIQRSEKWFVALCPELDVVSQGKTVEEARRNVTEAVELFLETASPSEIKRRLSKETYISPLAVAV
jgi:predicted RNase H-like HicB family nuclease